MSRASSGRRPPPNSNSIEGKYLMATVGPALVRGLAEIVERRPNDPIEYLATFLYKQGDNTRAQRQKEEEAKQLEIEKQKAEEERQHRAQLKKEIQALREQEEQERKEREAEEARKREAEELAKRHRELAAAARSSLPAVREEDDDAFTVEFGETELHRQAAIPNANLSKLLHDNPHSIASRNAKGKTPRDVAVDTGHQDNVQQIDQFCTELLAHGNKKAIIELLLCGYTELVHHLKPTEETAEFVNHEVSQLLAKIKELQRAIKEGNKHAVETLVNERSNIALYRSPEGSSSLHEAIEHQHFDLGSLLLQKCPSLPSIKDVHGRTSIDLLNAIDEDHLAGEKREAYNQLKEALVAAGTNEDE